MSFSSEDTNWAASVWAWVQAQDVLIEFKGSSIEDGVEVNAPVDIEDWVYTERKRRRRYFGPTGFAIWLQKLRLNYGMDTIRAVDLALTDEVRAELAELALPSADMDFRYVDELNNLSLTSSVLYMFRVLELVVP